MWGLNTKETSDFIRHCVRTEAGGAQRSTCCSAGSFIKSYAWERFFLARSCTERLSSFIPVLQFRPCRNVAVSIEAEWRTFHHYRASRRPRADLSVPSDLLRHINGPTMRLPFRQIKNIYIYTSACVPTCMEKETHPKKKKELWKKMFLTIY